MLTPIQRAEAAWQAYDAATVVLNDVYKDDGSTRPQRFAKALKQVELYGEFREAVLALDEVDARAWAQGGKQ